MNKKLKKFGYFQRNSYFLQCSFYNKKKRISREDY